MILFFIGAAAITWAAFLLYVTAMGLHTLSRAGMAVASPMTPLNSLREYLSRYWPKLIPQWFLGIALFLVVWDNEAVFGLLRFPMIGNKPLIRLGLAMVLGWFSDSVLDMFLTLFHIAERPAKLPDGPVQP
jgi:hypothetical protein